MKHLFVLDENVIHFALEDHSDCFQLVEAIARNCHKIVLAPDLWQGYQRAFAIPAANPRIRRVINSSIFSEDKMEFLAGADPIEGEEKIKNSERLDRLVARLAAARHAILVTTDQPLRITLQEESILNRYEFRVAAPPDALRWAQES